MVECLIESDDIEEPPPSSQKDNLFIVSESVALEEEVLDLEEPIVGKSVYLYLDEYVRDEEKVTFAKRDIPVNPYIPSRQEEYDLVSLLPDNTTSGYDLWYYRAHPAEEASLEERTDSSSNNDNDLLDYRAYLVLYFIDKNVSIDIDPLYAITEDDDDHNKSGKSLSSSMERRIIEAEVQSYFKRINSYSY